jgi:putative nucleotidyltransferase with HDIG domain
MDTELNVVLKPVPNQVQRERSFDLVQNLVQLISLKDKNTLEHSNRVYSLTRSFATYMRKKWSWIEIDVSALELAALLHDVGKVGVLDEVLNKANALTSIERDHLEQHSEIGYQLIRDYPGIQDIAHGVRHHHERWDGRGYPLGLKEEKIPKIAQIIAVVDAYDAITSDRPYRARRSHEEAMREIEKEAGRQFSPEVASEFALFMHSQNT